MLTPGGAACSHALDEKKRVNVKTRTLGGGGGFGLRMHDGDGMGVWGLAPSRGAGRSPAKKILASFGGLEAISVRKRHYQFGKPRPPNWAIFLLNILLLTQNQKKRAAAL